MPRPGHTARRISPFLGSPAQQIEAADAKAIGLDKLGTAMRPHVNTILKVSALALAATAASAQSCYNHNGDCSTCIASQDLSGWYTVDCEYCQASGMCSGSTFDSCTDDWSATNCDPDLPEPMSATDVLYYTTTCFIGGAIGAIESIATLLYDLADLADGEISSTCETLVASLEGKGTGEIEACDTNQLCAALGPLAMPCDVVFVGICVMNAGNAANPCQWLIDEAGGNPAAICTQLEQQMGLLPADDGGGH